MAHCVSRSTCRRARRTAVRHPGRTASIATGERPSELSPADDAGRSRVRFIFVLRGVVALAFGAAVLASGPNDLELVTLTAFYWLGASLLTLRWAAENRPVHSAPSFVAGSIGIVVAVLTLVVDAVAQPDGQQLVRYLLGMTAILTGASRIVDLFRDGVVLNGIWVVSHRIILGIIEMGLGLALVKGGEPAGSMAIVTGLWGIAGGTVLVLDALMLRNMRGRPAADGIILSG